MLIPPDTEGQETAPLPADKIMDIIYHSIPTTWKNKMIEQGFNYADSTIKEMTDFCETRVETLEPKEEKKKIFSSCQKIQQQEKSKEKEKGRLRLVESSEEFSVERRPKRKNYILHSK